MHRQSSLLTAANLAALLLTLGLVASSGCKPDYPSCETDKDCQDNGHAKEFCVARKCQQCRDSADCPTGNTCNAGKCTPTAGYCKSNSDCPANTACIANKCQACKSDKECPSGHCVKGACLAKKPCKTEDDCAQDEDCVKGFCTKEKAPAPPPTECRLDPVFFDFNESALTTEATATLAHDVDCLKKVGRVATLTGHTDPRGTQEYNLALSERRAQSVRDHLGRLGADGTKLTSLPRGALDAKGTDEPSWAQDRRVDFTWR
ncbi:MAG TPA: OmpA family protein [Polyangia bacterium]|jgi:peptidoglycan-associated lipoprotein